MREARGVAIEVDQVNLHGRAQRFRSGSFSVERLFLRLFRSGSPCAQRLDLHLRAKLNDAI
jgi:hypothetical protein